MNSFRYHVETDVRFGKDAVNCLPELLAPYGRKVLLVYGGGSIKKNGLYHKIMELLTEFEVFELSGVEPNPRITTVRAGADICKKENIDVVLAVGGGSTIDASKVIGAAAYYEGDAWDLVTTPSLIEKVLPITVVLTLAATGSEMNKNAVISNLETNEKLGTSSHNFIPKAAVCDPQYLYSLPAIQTAAGTADIMSHIFEQYFRKDTGAYMTDRFAESALKTCIKYCPIALKEPDNYEARANLMWASTVTLNGMLSCGKSGAWTCHAIEHELSAYYDITHGVGLAIVTPSWMRYILNDDTVSKFAEYGHNVWDIHEADAYECAKLAIDATEKFFADCGIPTKLSSLGIEEEKIELMAEDTIRHNDLSTAFVALSATDVANILKDCF